MSRELEVLAEEVLAASRALVAIAVQSLDDRAGDLTLVQYRSLVVLRYDEAMSTTALSAAIGVHQSTVTRASDHLVRKGLARKTRDDRDRRRTLIALTAAGEELVDAVMAARRDLVCDVLVHMPLPDAQRTAAVMRLFTEAAQVAAGPHGHRRGDAL
jgi:DNA-binding MarR family transcriptional regulator